ncbi:MAG: hypothetical protein WC777_01770 [Candidatus Gracilibacteria bacterium]
MKKKHIPFLVVGLLVVLFVTAAFSDFDKLKAAFSGAFTPRDIVVSPSGSDTGAGSSTDPMSLEGALASAPSGATLVLLSGTYPVEEPLALDRELSMKGRGGAVIDCSEIDSDLWCMEFGPGIGDSVRFENFTFTHALNGVHIQGGSPEFEDMTFLRGTLEDSSGSMDESYFLVSVEDGSADFNIINSKFSVAGSRFGGTGYEGVDGLPFGLHITDGSSATVTGMDCQGYYFSCVLFTGGGSSGEVRNSLFAAVDSGVMIDEGAGGVDILGNGFIYIYGNAIYFGEGVGESFIAQNQFAYIDHSSVYFNDFAENVEAELMANFFRPGGPFEGDLSYSTDSFVGELDITSGYDLYVDEVEDLYVHHNFFEGTEDRTAILIRGGTDPIDGNLLIEQNWFDDYAIAIALSAEIKNLIVNNVFLNMTRAIVAGGTITFAYNTLVGGEIGLDHFSDYPSLIVDNIFVGFDAFAITSALSFTDSVQMGFNAFFDNGTDIDGVLDYDDLGGNVYDDPDFVDSDENDFHLEAGSPLIDVGSGFVSVSGDYEADPRVVPDIGAFEY